jgi:hypothetical protein
MDPDHIFQILVSHFGVSGLDKHSFLFAWKDERTYRFFGGASGKLVRDNRGVRVILEPDIFLKQDEYPEWASIQYAANCALRELQEKKE